MTSPEDTATNTNADPDFSTRDTSEPYLIIRTGLKVLSEMWTSPGHFPNRRKKGTVENKSSNMLNDYCWSLISETPTDEYEAKEDVMFNDDFL